MIAEADPSAVPCARPRRGEEIFNVTLTGLTAAIQNLTANATAEVAAPEVRVVAVINESGLLQVVDALAVFAAPNTTAEDKGLGGKLKGFFGAKEDGKKDANETETAGVAKDEVKKDVVKKLGLEYSYPKQGPLTKEQKWTSRAKSVLRTRSLSLLHLPLADMVSPSLPQAPGDRLARALAAPARRGAQPPRGLPLPPARHARA